MALQTTALRTLAAVALLAAVPAGAAPPAPGAPAALPFRQDAAGRAAENARLLRPRASAADSLPALRYKVIARGDAAGPFPGRNSIVTVRFEGSLADGSEFATTLTDTGDLLSFPVRSVIPGMSAALQLMRPGDTWLLYIPHELAYGHRGEMAEKDLFFRLELVGFEEGPPPPAPFTKPAAAQGEAKDGH